MSPRPDVSEERRNQIVEAATRVFARLGFNKARMDDIVDESGLSKGTLYWYFKSKDDIITAILDSMFKREVARMNESLGSDLSAKERLIAFTEFIIEDIVKMKPLLPILFEFWGLLMRRKTVKQVLGQYYLSYMNAATPIIQQGIDQGEFRPVDPDSVAIAIGAIFEGTIILWAYAPETIELNKHIKTSIDLIIEGLEVR
ncbi:MAG: TetR/AcrR family transcriptional regulator [Chloroflexi bacterium]|nr:TetR/AcrR family transcriptional regulator [Chloroflexota bacterium]